jgi:diguanylate cyclase (GGDEF)-like protein
MDLLNTIIKFLKELEYTPIPVILKDSSFRWLYCNQEIIKLYNLDENFYKGRKGSEFLPIEDSIAGESSDKLTAESGKTSESYEVYAGRYFKVYKTPIYENGQLICIIMLAIEGTDLENSKNRAIYLKNFYKALSRINQMITKNPDPQELCDDVCNLIGTLTNVPVVWIGSVDIAKNRLNVLSQYRTPDAPDIKDYFISLDPLEPSGTGPVATSIRTKNPQIIQDIFQCEMFNAWQYDLKKFSDIIKSAAVFPIKKFGEAVSVLVVFAGQKNFFNEELINLLDEVSLDIGFSFEEYEKNEKISYLSLYDQLTGLANRDLFNDRLNQAISRAERKGILVAVSVIDIDGFHNINEKFGHKVGDEILKEVSKRISSILRQSDTIARLGSDEFGMIFQDISDISDLNPIFDKINDIFSFHATIENNDISLNYNMGISIYPDDGSETEIILRRAESALTQAKTEKDLRVRFFKKSIEEEFERSYRIQNLFLKAIDEKKVLAYYQPQVNTVSGKLIGLEALARLEVDGGIMLPKDFIEYVEAKTELITILGEQMINIVLRDIIKFKEIGIDVPVSVNIGVKHLTNPNFIPNLKKILLNNEYDVYKHLKFEITETLYLNYTEKIQNVLNEIKKLNFLISIDDFGTGYASFNYIKNIPVDQIKLDISFIRNLLEDNKNLAIVTGILTTAKMLELDIIAEGVENIETAEILKTVGCDKIQGFFIAKPMPFDELHDWHADYKLSRKLAELIRSENKGILIHQHIIGLFTISLYHSLRVYQAIEVLSGNIDIKTHSNILKGIAEPDSFRKCQLGKWCEKMKDSYLFKDNPAFLELVKKHEEIHSLVRDFILSNKTISTDERTMLLDRSSEIVNLIWKLASL